MFFIVEVRKFINKVQFLYFAKSVTKEKKRVLKKELADNADILLSIYRSVLIQYL